MKRILNKTEAGFAGERDAAFFWLSQHPQAKMVAQNYRVKAGEIDLIFEDRDTLVFVEVRTRSNSLVAEPIDSITKTKIARLGRAIQAFLLVYQGRAKNVRVDYLFKTGEKPWQHIRG